MGFFLEDDEPVIWRGPMLGRAMEQFLGDVLWGSPDYLLIDLPPGTGDIALTIAQMLPSAEMIVVTTPQEAAAKIAAKAAKMAVLTKHRIIGVVENMSYFVCPIAARSTSSSATAGPSRSPARPVPRLLGPHPPRRGDPQRRRPRRAAGPRMPQAPSAPCSTTSPAPSTRSSRPRRHRGGRGGRGRCLTPDEGTLASL